MKIGFITNIRSPYKTLQISEFCKIDNVDITVYYTEPENKKIKWEELKSGFKEVNLEQYKFLLKYNLILNKKIRKIILEHDFILLSGYDQLTMIYSSILCRIYNKPYTILFDGISKYRLNDKENKIKKVLKSIVIKGSHSVMANGSIGRKYLQQKFNYPSYRIYNQYLSIDYSKIRYLAKDKIEYRNYYRNKYNIQKDKKVVLYSGRLIEKKNVESIIQSISILNRSDIMLLITGGGVLESNIKELANRLGVDIKITGFINEQELLFKHYFSSDVLILPSKDEPWGLVVNECMAAELPVLVSDICGCSEDLVLPGENGYLIDPFDIEDIATKIEKVLYQDSVEKMGRKSLEIISEWTFEKSRQSLEAIIKSIQN